MAARLTLANLEWDRSCADCQKYVYNDDGTVLTHRGVVMPRPPGDHPPCYRCVKVPFWLREQRRQTGGEVTPADAIEPEDRHRQAVAHYLECSAVGDFPKDPLVRRCAAIIRPVQQAAERKPLEVLVGTMASILKAK